MKIKILIKNKELTKYDLNRKHYNDAGIDVYALKNIELKAFETIRIPLGFGIELPDGYMGLVLPRSSLATKGIISHSAPIDSGYNGEIHAIFTATSLIDGQSSYQIKKGDRVAQLVIQPIVLSDLILESNWEFKERNQGAFGSTGK
ncbi:MAG: hypothetical protein OHM56_02980 [Spiroplasma phoeniceum]|nr:MAG: hypothetical protein OHM57_02430 [Spiroplasma phoeniceum]UZQ32929.1 MAG: hypothetical protein OHM56_02980 [Spiroplasma phoeniceum]